MDKLKKAREEINRVDREMAALFVRRMEASREVAAYKREHGLPILDPTREEEVISRNLAFVEDSEMRGYYDEFLRRTMKISRDYQRKLNEGMRVAFCGVLGAFAAIAAGRIFPGATLVPFGDFRSAYRAAKNGDCDCAVLPVENSTAGEVGQVMDLMFSGPLTVNGIYDLSISHHLMALPGAQIENIREVVSHPQALEQCGAYLAEKGWRQVRFENTAMAACHVVEGRDLSIAAIASEETAKLYGLEILARNIHTSGMNTTRFVVLSRAAAREVGTGAEKHSLLTFTVRHEAGALARVIGVIGQYGYNMRCLRSRPMKDLVWQYYFYVEAEGDIDSEKGRRMMAELAPLCDRLRLLGTFRYPANI